MIIFDKFNRRFTYLRLSITDRCNLKCFYCLPNGCEVSSTETELSISEINNLISAFAELGINKVRISGGEPTVRKKDLLEIIKNIKQIAGIEIVAVTTNGTFQTRYLQSLKDAGLDRINFSLDALNDITYKEVTQSGKFNNVIANINEALSIGFDKVKLNAVLLHKINDIEFKHYMQMIKDSDLTVRFIELMKTETISDELFDKYKIQASEFIDKLEADGWKQTPKAVSAGPALEYEHKDYRGNIGFITPYSNEFCKTCNRLRISNKGVLQLCLFNNESVSLRELLQSTKQKEQLKELIVKSIFNKPERHLLHKNISGNRVNLASIGG